MTPSTGNERERVQVFTFTFTFQCCVLLMCLQLVGSDRWFCPTCRCLQTGTTKSLSLSFLPDVLVIQLKRFKQVSTAKHEPAVTSPNSIMPIYVVDTSHEMGMPHAIFGVSNYLDFQHIKAVATESATNPSVSL